MDLEQKKSFAVRLAKLREERNLTQQELADETNILRVTIAKYESQKRIPSFEDLTTLAKYFNTTTDYFLGLTNVIRVEKPEDEILKIVCDATGLTVKALKYILIIKTQGYIGILNNLLSSGYLIPILESIDNCLTCANNFFNNLSAKNDILTEYQNNIEQSRYILKFFATHDMEVLNIKTLCQDRLEQETDYYIYQSLKKLEETISLLIDEQYYNDLNKLAKEIYEMYHNEQKETPDNGNNNPKKE